jgi:hypothetical protein
VLQHEQSEFWRRDCRCARHKSATHSVCPEVIVLGAGAGRFYIFVSAYGSLPSPARIDKNGRHYQKIVSAYPLLGVWFSHHRSFAGEVRDVTGVPPKLSGTYRLENDYEFLAATTRAYFSRRI